MNKKIEFENIRDQKLWKVISLILKKMEEDEEIVICSSSSVNATSKIHDAIASIVPKTNLSDLDLYAIRSLILEAIDDGKFFDREMPTLTGYSADQFRKIAMKLPKE